MSKKLSIVFLVFLIVSLAFSFVQFVPTVKANPDLLEGWSYRKQITITGQSGAGTNYQVLLKVGETSGATGENFDVEGHCQDTDWSNGVDDITFTDDDGETELYHWLEATSGSGANERADFWVKVTDNLDSNVVIYIYYGKSSGVPTSYRDATNTFLFFDHFLGTELNTSKWYVSLGTGSVAVSDSIVTVTGGTPTVIGGKTQFGYPKALRTLIKTTENNWVITGWGDRSADGQYIGVGVDQANLLFNTVTQWQNLKEGATTLVSRTVSVSTFKIIDICRKSDSVKFFGDGTLEQTVTTNVPLDNMGAWLEANTAGRKVECDWVLIRNYVDPEPIFSSAESEEGFNKYITFYVTVGGQFRANNVTKTNATETTYLNGSVLELVAVPNSSSYVFVSFNWTGGSSTTNPYNYTVTVNMTIWCYFGIAEGVPTPYIISRFTFNVSNPEPNENIFFNGSYSRSSSSITAYTWDFGDTNTENIAEPTHYYNIIGVFSVNLTVTSSIGTDSFIQNITVAWSYETGYADGYAVGYSDGYNDGYSIGWSEGNYTGWTQGWEEGNATGYGVGYSEGYDIGYAEGYALGLEEGYQTGYSEGYDIGYSTGYGEGVDIGYSQGYNDGYVQGWYEGNLTGWTEGWTIGNATGYEQGYQIGYQVGNSTGYINGYNIGYAIGYEEGGGSLEDLRFSRSFVFLTFVLSLCALAVFVRGREKIKNLIN